MRRRGIRAAGVVLIAGLIAGALTSCTNTSQGAPGVVTATITSGTNVLTTTSAAPVVVPPLGSATAAATRPTATITGTPALNSTDISPITPISIAVAGGTITELALNKPDGGAVVGAISADRVRWTLGEVLGYGKTYAVVGLITLPDGSTQPLSGTYSTVNPSSTVRTTISPADNAVVGVAVPIQLNFTTATPQSRAAIEKVVSITTVPKVEGAWAWIHHDGGIWGLDYRPKEYWPEGTKVHVEAKLYGVDFGNGNWGREDLTTDFTVGRNQVVVADVNSHQLVVKQDGKVVHTYPASYGKGIDEDTTTRSGVHIVMEKDEVKIMNNPRYGYTNLPEKWAVRISNNGEFIHANPNSVDAQGNTNVSHGCVNLSLENAEEYFRSAIYGDPVEITGTNVQLAPSDGDIFDWAIPWSTWVSLSGKNG